MNRRYPRFGLTALLIAVSLRAAAAPPAFERGMQALLAGDYAEAFCHWKPLAENGYAEAQYHIGWLYANGNGLAVDIERALGWWRSAARQGHADAQFAVGLAYTTGDGVAKDLDEAADWYLAAARQGHQDARDILMRLNGDPSVDLLQRHPELLHATWFGWSAQVDGARVNLRRGPGTTHAIVAQLGQGDRLRVIGRRGDWYMVIQSQHPGESAWVYSGLVSGVDDEAGLPR